MILAGQKRPPTEAAVLLKSFVEKLSGAKSFDKVIEIQTEFAKTAYETFVTESQKITALYGDLAKQSYKPFGGFVAKMTPTNR
jgi:hypothetical protein